MARFGPIEKEEKTDTQEKKKKGGLEFTLDEYKIKNKKQFPGKSKNFAKNNKFKNKEFKNKDGKPNKTFKAKGGGDFKNK